MPQIGIIGIEMTADDWWKFLGSLPTDQRTFQLETSMEFITKGIESDKMIEEMRYVIENLTAQLGGHAEVPMRVGEDLTAKHLGVEYDEARDVMVLDIVAEQG